MNKTSSGSTRTTIIWIRSSKHCQTSSVQNNLQPTIKPTMDLSIRTRRFETNADGLRTWVSSGGDGGHDGGHDVGHGDGGGDGGGCGGDGGGCGGDGGGGGDGGD